MIHRRSSLKRALLPTVKRFAPAPVREGAGRVFRRLATWMEDRTPWSWHVTGSLRRTRPVRRNFGWRSGQCVDRYYIERFLADHEADIRGRVLEIGDRDYTMRFGGDRVTRSDVLHAKEGNPVATLVGDLSRPLDIADDSFDAVILTQTLAHIYDTGSAVRSVYRILKPGGVVLASLSGIRQISRYDMEQWGDFWRFTTLSSRRLFETSFPAGAVSIEAHGNVLAATAFLHGLHATDLRPFELDFHDRDYEVVITVRAEKPG
jgi:SAM-dependent methyltransferase